MNARGETALGIFVGSTDPSITESIAAAGYDFVVIDCEHTPMDAMATLHHVRAARSCRHPGFRAACGTRRLPIVQQVPRHQRPRTRHPPRRERGRPARRSLLRRADRRAACAGRARSCGAPATPGTGWDDYVAVVGERHLHRADHRVGRRSGQHRCHRRRRRRGRALPRGRGSGCRDGSVRSCRPRSPRRGARSQRRPSATASG